MKYARLPSKRTRRWLIALMIGGVASFVLGATVLASSGPVPTALSRKQMLLQQVAAQETAAAHSPHAPKIPTTPMPTPNSCPMPSGGRTEILPGSMVDPVAARPVSIRNGAIIAPIQGRPFSYLLIAGALKANPQQGVLVVISQPQDPCAQGPQWQFKLYNSPFQQGALTLTHINGEVVGFTTAAGGMGQFNYITGQFL